VRGPILIKILLIVVITLIIFIVLRSRRCGDVIPLLQDCDEAAFSLLMGNAFIMLLRRCLAPLRDAWKFHCLTL
jgi:hypothetical protein